MKPTSQTAAIFVNNNLVRHVAVDPPLRHLYGDYFWPFPPLWVPLIPSHPFVWPVWAQWSSPPADLLCARPAPARVCGLVHPAASRFNPISPNGNPIGACVSLSHTQEKRTRSARTRTPDREEPKAESALAYQSATECSSSAKGQCYRGFMVVSMETLFRIYVWAEVLIVRSDMTVVRSLSTAKTFRDKLRV